jgi:hypothetical protein
MQSSSLKQKRPTLYGVTWLMLTTS